MLNFFLLVCTFTEVCQPCELRAIIRQHRVDRVGHGGDESAQEVGGDSARGLRMELSKSKLARPIDGYEKKDATFFRMPLGNVNMEVPGGYFLNFLLARLSPSTSERRLMPLRWSQRCNVDRVRWGMLSCKA
jgi:hypothetical protein